MLSEVKHPAPLILRYASNDTPLTRPSATLSPLTRGEGNKFEVPLLPACGEKVPEGRMRGHDSRA